MNAFSTVTAAALLAAGAATVATAQTPTPSDPSAASSPSQRQATGSAASESPTSNGTDPGAASSPHQNQAMKHSSSADMQDAATAGARPETFVKTAAQDGMTEVALAKLALSKSSNDEVKQFAQKMEQDHTKADQQLSSIARTKGIAVPTQLDAKHQAMVKSLGAKSGAAFDSAYATHMAKGHAKAVALFQAAAQSSDPDLAAFAQKTLPTIEVHKQLADSLEASTGNRSASAQGGSQTR
jgi:putative membrane protein